MSFSSIAARKPHPHAEVIKAWADGAQVQFQYYATKEWGDDNSPQFHVERQYRVKPERIYPETRLGDGEICSAYYGGGPVKGPDEETKAWYRVANAALRHAIDADQVVPMSEVQEVARNLNKRRYERAERALLSAGFEDLGGQEWKPPLGKAPHFIEVSDPKRDMAIAEAVRKFCENKAANDSTKYAAYKAIQDADLAAIIAGVRP